MLCMQGNVYHMHSMFIIFICSHMCTCAINYMYKKSLKKLAISYTLMSKGSYNLLNIKAII